MFIYLLIYLLYDFPVCPTIVGGRSSNSEREQEENENQIEDEDEDEDSQPTPSSSSSSFLRQIDEILSKCPEKVMMTIMMLIMIIIMIIVRLTINSNIITYLVVSVDALPIIFHPLSLQILIFDRLY